MSKKLEFIMYVEKLLLEASEPMNDEARLYWEAFKETDEKEKTKFTENGKLILEFLQNNPQSAMWKAKDIAEGLGISSRSVSGAMRKLVTDEYVEKLGKDPIIYTITELGKNIDLKGENK